MAFEGMMVNAAVTLLAGLSYAYVSTEALRARRNGPAGIATVLLLALIAVHLSVAGLRQLVAFVSLHDARFEGLDAALFLVVNVPGALTAVPLVFLVLERHGMPWRAALPMAVAYLAIALVGLAAFVLEGIEGPTVSYWGTDYAPAGAQTRLMLALLFAVPAISASLALAILGARGTGPDARGTLLLGLALLVYYGAIVPDGFGADGALLLALRLATAASAALAYRSVFDEPPAAARRAEPS